MSNVEEMVRPIAKRTDSPAISGVLVGVTDAGVPLVRYEGSAGIVQAKSSLSRQECQGISQFPLNVVLLLLEGDITTPVITGIVKDVLELNTEITNDYVLDTTGDGNHITIKQKSITFLGNDEIKLECGKSSILLRRDGKVVIKGVNLVSRSSSSNRIKGSSVSIN